MPLVVDDCLRDVWLDGPPPPALGAFVGPRPAESPVITVGSLSKTVWGGLRLGWLRGPRALVRRIATARASDDVAPPVLGQLVAVALLEQVDDLAAASRDRLRAGPAGRGLRTPVRQGRPQGRQQVVPVAGRLLDQHARPGTAPR